MATANPEISVKQAVAVLVVLAVVSGGYYGVRHLLQPPTQPDVETGKVVADEFLARIRQGKAGEAWDAATAELKSIEGRESFIRKARSAPILKGPLQFNSIQQVAVQDRPRTELLYQSPDAKMVRILIGYEQGSWKVDRLTL